MDQECSKALKTEETLSFDPKNITYFLLSEYICNSRQISCIPSMSLSNISMLICLFDVENQIHKQPFKKS